MSFSAPSPFRKTHRLQYATLGFAVAILIITFYLARKQETHQIVHDTTWLRQTQRNLASSIENLEKQWRETVVATAQQEWRAEPDQRGKTAANTFGIQQITFFTDNKPQHIPLHQKPGSVRLPQPSLIKGKGDFFISQDILDTSQDGAWIHRPPMPDIYVLHKGNKDRAGTLVLMLNPDEAFNIVVDEIKNQQHAGSHPESSSGYFEINLGDSSPVHRSGNQNLKAHEPDEKIHHFSNLGEWTLRYWHARQTRIHYHSLTLTIGSLLALATLAAGWWINREHQRMLQLAASRVSFVNAVSHELRTPLTNIILSADFIDESAETPRLKRSIHQIREESHRLTRMVENVLNFSRFEGGKLTPDIRHHIDVEKLLVNCLDQFRPSYKRKNITVETHIPKLETLNTDPDFLSQIFLNLLSNVEKYAGRDSSMQVTAETTPAHLRIVVSDNGPGISAKHANRIFESFERVNETITTGVSGAGLGLAISRELAHQLGGDLTLLPTNHGASFQFLIPIT